MSRIVTVGPVARTREANRSIAGIDVAANDPEAMAGRWAELAIDHAVRFVPAGPRGEGIDAVDLVAAHRERAGEAEMIGGVELRLV